MNGDGISTGGDEAFERCALIVSGVVAAYMIGMVVLVNVIVPLAVFLTC